MKAHVICFTLRKGVMRSFPSCPPDECSGIHNPHLHYGKKHYSLMPEKNETQHLPPSWPNDLKTKSSGQDRIKWPLIHTICTTVGVHTQQAQIHKSPLGSLLSLPAPQEGWQPWPIRKMWLSLKCFLGCHWRRQQSVKVRVTEHSITHHWFFSTPPQGSGFPLELGPQRSSSPPRIPQCHEGDAPDLPPSLSIAKEDSYQEEKQKLGGRP